MTFHIKKFSAACAFALLLAGNTVFAEVEVVELLEADDQEEGFEATDVTRKDRCRKNKTYGILTVCNALNVLGTANIEVANIANQTIDNLVVNGTTTLNGLLSLTSPNVLDYGYFYTADTGTPQTADYTTGTAVGASYVAATGGITIEQAGIYSVAYSATFLPPVGGGSVTFGLVYDSTPIPGTEVSFISTASSPISETVIVDIATPGFVLGLSSTTVLESVNGQNSATLTVVRVR